MTAESKPEQRPVQKPQTTEPAKGGTKPASPQPKPSGDSPKPHGDPFRHRIADDTQ